MKRPLRALLAIGVAMAASPFVAGVAVAQTAGEEAVLGSVVPAVVLGASPPPPSPPATAPTTNSPRIPVRILWRRNQFCFGTAGAGG